MSLAVASLETIGRWDAAAHAARRSFPRYDEFIVASRQDQLSQTQRMVRRAAADA